MSGRCYFIFAAVSILLFTSISTDAATIGGRFYPIIEDTTVSSPKPIDNLVDHFDNKIKIIFSDIDGTMLPFDKKNQMVEFPSNVKQTVKKLHESKIPLILTTGRSYTEAKDIAHELGNENSYMITHQGAQIVDPKGEFIYQDNIKNTDVQKILKKIEALKKHNNINSDVVVFTETKVYATKETKLPANWEKITVIKSFQDLKKANICKITISEQNPKNLRIFQSALKKDFPKYDIVLSSEFYCDITSHTATKGNAVKKLAKILGIDLKNIAALGDAENDISMLNLVKANGGIAIVPGNAMPQTKYSANYITSTVFNGGFSKAIDKLLLNNASLP